MLGSPAVNPTHRPTRLALVVCAGLLACAAAAPERAVPPPVAPPPADSAAKIDSKPAPLLLPGRPNPGDAARLTREQKAREQYGLARGLEEQGAAAAAIIAFHRAAELDPKMLGPHEHAGRLYAAARQYEAAVREFAAEVTLDPGNRRVARQLGVALANAGDSTNAIRQLELLTRRSARDTASWKALGFAYGLANRPADAERALRRATELDPKDAEAWRDLGLVRALRGDRTEARAAYARAAKLDPDDGTSFVNLGNLETRAGRLPEALEAYQQAEDRDSTLDAAYEGQVRVLDMLGRTDGIGAVYRRWLVARPAAREVRLAAIKHFDGRGRSDIALELARDGVRVDPGSSEAHVTLGLALEAAGDVPGMLEELRKAQRFTRSSERRAKIDATIASLRAKAPESLRAAYAADSVAHAAAPPDTADTTGSAR